ncbi:TlpA family protein disulfide reductase [Frateuria aurantia]
MRITPTRLILGLAIAAGLAAEWQQWHARQPQPPAPQVAGLGDLAPDLQLNDLQGHPHHLSEYPGPRRILNFWASWCGPCLDEMPALDHAATSSQASIIGIAMDRPAAARQFLQDHPVHYPILLGQLKPPSTSARFDDNGGLLPYSVLLDASGKVLARHAGALDPAMLARWLDPASTP